MVVVEADGALVFLDVLEGSLRSGRLLSDGEVERILSMGFMSFMVDAYSSMIGLTRADVASFLRNLGEENPVSVNPVKSMFEDGFRSCYTVERIAELRGNIEKILGIDFEGAERKALSCLPPGTVIECTVYLTVDAFNPGMVWKGGMGRSILSPVRDSGNLSHLAHEFHHLGFGYWVSKSPTLERAFRGEKTHDSVAARLVLHLIMEGMANHFCTPGMVRPGPGRSPRVNEKITRYEREFKGMLGEVTSLLADCVARREPVEECEVRLMDIVLDKERTLPKVHFLGAKVMELFDRDPEIGRDEIVGLCRNPQKFLSMYNKVAEKSDLPIIDDETLRELEFLFERLMHVNATSC